MQSLMNRPCPFNISLFLLENRFVGKRRGCFAMWPFTKKEKKPIEPISYSQVDITEAFGDNERLGPDEWISTVPLNATTKNPESMGLPPSGASADEVYRVASKLSALRELVPIPNDGVYCPVCHIANVDLGRLHKPCPKCGRELLKFGWD